jgi:hypothetical protein
VEVEVSEAVSAPLGLLLPRMAVAESSTAGWANPRTGWTLNNAQAKMHAFTCVID